MTKTTKESMGCNINNIRAIKSTKNLWKRSWYSDNAFSYHQRHLPKQKTVKFRISMCLLCSMSLLNLNMLMAWLCHYGIIQLAPSVDNEYVHEPVAQSYLHAATLLPKNQILITIVKCSKDWKIGMGTFRTFTF